MEVVVKMSNFLFFRYFLFSFFIFFSFQSYSEGTHSNSVPGWYRDMCEHVEDSNQSGKSGFVGEAGDSMQYAVATPTLNFTQKCLGFFKVKYNVVFFEDQDNHGYKETRLCGSTMKKLDQTELKNIKNECINRVSQIASSFNDITTTPSITNFFLQL